MFSIILKVVLVIIVLLLLASTIKIVPQEKEYVVERLGKYSRTLKAGINILIPFIDSVRRKVDTREKTGDYEPQPVITKDNVTIQIDSVIYYHIFDSHLYTYGVVNPEVALETLTATTLRNLIGDLELDESLTSRDEINSKMRVILDEATDAWGIKVSRVEVKNIIPPKDIQNAMERQMRAERERRALVTESEGRKQAEILKAEGEKASLVLRAEAEKEAAIAKAQGQAEAIKLMYEAQAKGIQEINNANPSPAYVQLEGFKYLKDLANGQATKIIIPSNMASLASTITSASELIKSDPLNVNVDVESPEPDPYAHLRTEHDSKTHRYDQQTK